MNGLYTFIKADSSQKYFDVQISIRCNYETKKEK